jgi:hypothetical protein
MMRSARWIVFAGLTACASTPAGEGGANEPTTDQADDGEPENERERMARLAMDQRDQCNRLGDAIQSVEVGEDEIVNLNDSGKLARLAKKRQEAADKVAAIAITSVDLVPIRDDYVRNAKDMAQSLQSTATEKKDADRKAALKRYQTLDGETAGIIDRFNSACDGGGPKATSEEGAAE